MFALSKRLFTMLLLLGGAAAVLLLALHTFAAPQPASSDEVPASVPDPFQQAAPTPTSGFGPIITAGPGGPSTPQPTPPPATLSATATPPRPVITATPTIEGTPLPGLQAEVMGIQIDPAMSQEDYDFALWLCQRLGVKWLKFQFAWYLLEPQPGQFSDILYKYRLFVQQADRAGFNVMISIAKAPGWARATTDEDGPPRNPQDLANFITRLMSEIRVDLYGNSYFEAIEVWNEPNLRREWNGAPINGGEYMRLFDTAYRAVRAGEGGHSVTLVTAGLAPTGINDGTSATDDRAYLQQMYAAGLASPAYENIAIGVHPYGAANPPDARWCGQENCGGSGYNNHPTWFFLDTLEDYHAIMLANGDTARQLWATEFGWGTYQNFFTSTGDPAPSPVEVPYFEWITEDQQAAYILRAFEIGQDLPYMGVMILWNLNYADPDYVDIGDERAAYAIIRPPGTEPLRPAFLQLEAAPKQEADE